MSAFLELTALRKVYDDGTEAVAGVDLGFGEGELVVLLGPSGCGKSTTLRMVAGLERPTAGTVTLAGAPITHLPPQDRDVGFVFQFYALYPHMTVFENIAFPLQSIGVAAAQVRERVQSMVDRLDLGDLAARRPRALSGGDQQRVALARAMVRRPRLWLMDEPLGTLDGERRLEMRAWIRAQQLAAGTTTLYVTHDQEEAMALADRIVVMAEGRVRQCAPPAEVYDHPADLFTAHFVGSPGMNFVEGFVTHGSVELGPTARLPLPDGVEADGEAVTLGVRPEFLRPAPGAGTADAGVGVVAGQVVLDELLGAHRNIHLDTPVGRLVMRRPAGEAHAAGQALAVTFDAAGLRWFRTSTGERLQ